MDDRITLILTFIKKHLLTLNDIQISGGYYIIMLNILDDNFNFSVLSNVFNKFCLNMKYKEIYIEESDEFIQIMLPVIFTKEILDNMSNFNWHMKYTDRSISPIRFNEYIESIIDKRLKTITSLIVENTIYINFETFIYNLDFLSERLPDKFNLVIDSYKIGSEHWIILLIWKKIKHKVIKIINRYYDIDNNYPLVYMDDSIYTGRNIISSMSVLINEHNEMLGNKNVDNLEYFDERGIKSVVNKTLKNNIILACPYVSNISTYYLNNFQNKANVNISILTQNITTATVNILYDSLQNTLYKFNNINELLDYSIDNFNTKDTNVAIYFDHKIANNFGSFPNLYSKIVKKLPDRYKINEIENMLLEY